MRLPAVSTLGQHVFSRSLPRRWRRIGEGGRQVSSIDEGLGGGGGGKDGGNHEIGCREAIIMQKSRRQCTDT